MASSAMDQPLGHEHRPAPRRLRAWLRKLTGAWAGADSRRRRAWLALGRMFKLVVLLALIVVSLTSTTVLDRPSQVFLLKAFRGVRLLGGLALTGLPRMPDQALRFGFIGSYAFIMQSLVRRYFQADLKTHAYLSAIARVILVAALITAIHPLWSPSCSRPAHRSTGCSTGSTRRSCTCGCATATTATGTATTTRTAPAGCCAATGSGRRRTCSARSTTPTAWTPGSARRSCAC